MVVLNAVLNFYVVGMIGIIALHIYSNSWQDFKDMTLKDFIRVTFRISLWPYFLAKGLIE